MNETKKAKIIESVLNNNVTIIKTDTESAKTTKIPQVLYDAGYDVIIAKPRNTQSTNAAKRFKDELKYINQLVRALNYHLEISKPRVLIIDEVDKWSVGIEVLIALCKKYISDGWNVKVVVISSAYDCGYLKKYFGNDAIVLKLNSKAFDVEMSQSTDVVCNIVESFTSKGENVLVFVPSKKDIPILIRGIKDLNIVALEFHEELEPIKKNLCFLENEKPKVIVATNGSQASLMGNKDINAVIDTGYEYRIEFERFFERFSLQNISKTDCNKRKLIAGKRSQGSYVICSSIGMEARVDKISPEIYRYSLEQVVLRLASFEIDVLQLEFFHELDSKKILEIKEMLVNLGALKDNNVTQIGYEMSNMPITCKYARMLIEANKHHVVGDVIAIIAILEVGSLLEPKKGIGYSKYTDENTSDLLAELDIWNKISSIGPIDFKKEGISSKNYFKIKRFVEMLKTILCGLINTDSIGDRHLIKLSCISGMVDNLYLSYHDGYLDLDNNFIKLDKKSCIVVNPEWVVGIKKTINVKDSWGKTNKLSVICMSTKVELEWLIKLAPQIFEIKENLEPYYDFSKQCCMVITQVKYKGKVISEKHVEAPNHPEELKLKQQGESLQKKRQSSQYTSTTSYFDNICETQRIIKCDGYEFVIGYDFNKAPHITIEKDLLFQIKKTSLKLDNGKVVSIRCGEYSSNNFPALREKIENDRIQQCWNEVKSSLPSVSSTKISVILTWLEKVGQIQVTRANNNLGEEIKGYIYLELSGKKVRIKVTEDETIFVKSTNEALVFLLKKEIEENYYKKFSLLDKDNQRVRAGKRMFDSLVRESIDNLTYETFEKTLDNLSEFFEMINQEYLI